MIHSDTFCVGSRPRLKNLDAPCGLGCASPKFGLEDALSLGEPGWTLDHTRVQAGIRVVLWQLCLSEQILTLLKGFMSYFTSSFPFLLFYFPSWFICSPPFLMLSGHLLVCSSEAFFSSFCLKQTRQGWSVDCVCFSEGCPCCTERKIIPHPNCPWLPSPKVRRDGMVQKVLWKLCCVTLPLVCVIHQSNYMCLRNLRLLQQWHSPVAFLFPSN